MPPMTLLIKPASSACNLACEYCFYADVSDHRAVKSYGKMTIDNLEIVVKKAMEVAEGTCTFAFQGGEPTLVGIDFYKALVKFQKRYQKAGLTVQNAIQTNGTLINEEWAEFFAKNNFLVGLSLDGTKAINDSLRRHRDQTGTFDTILQTTRIFDAHKVEYNILTVVTKQVARGIKEIYDFYMENDLKYMQFIPCIDDIEDERGSKAYSLTAEDYGQFLCDLFDKWHVTVSSGGFVYIRYFENLLQLLCGYYPEACGMLGVCTHQYVIEADGGVYPCDFYVMDDYKIGNILEDSFDLINQKREGIQFIHQSIPKDSGCAKCKWHKLCRGGCRRDRDLFMDGKTKRNYFCRSYKTFFKHAYPRLEQVAMAIRNNRGGNYGL
ncbi:MAG: anaerobic sulfatase maturase [Cellulosilyticaceae bacterium]